MAPFLLQNGAVAPLYALKHSLSLVWLSISPQTAASNPLKKNVLFSSSTFRLNPPSRKLSFFFYKTLNLIPQNPHNAFQNLFVSFLKVKFIQPTINVISILPMYAPPCPKNHLFSLKHAATLSPSSLNVDPLSVYLMA